MEALRARKGVSGEPCNRPSREAAKARSGSPREEPLFRAAGAGEKPRLPFELAAFEHLLPPAFLLGIGRRARQLGVGGDEVLRCGGYVREEEAADAMARRLGLPLVDAIDDLGPPQLPAPGATLDWAKGLLRTGVHAALDGGGRVVFTIAAQGRSVARLARALRVDPGLRARTRLIAPGALRRQVMRETGDAIAADAAFAFRDTAPAASAGALDSRQLVPLLALGVMASLIVTWMLAGALSLLIVQSLLSLIFLSWTMLRLAGCYFIPTDDAPELDLDDRHLPVYTLLIPLYKEAKSVPGLISAMRALDYPPEKLDIKLVVEADDADTRAAIAAIGLPAHMEEVAVPNVGPRTKPKALNMALAFARGSYVAVFDAEDEPEEDQLKRALAAFRKGGSRVACVQARLCVDNGAERWISGHFAAEYAGQFDVLLPVLNALKMPILLGGTSNHFRRDILEQLGGWDPFNVTEDADLGIRLARAGWRTEVIASSTFEEAPVALRAWLGQRTRWLKGWAQTILVHGRNPRALVRDLGWRGTAAMLVLTAGPFASALLHPFCLLLLAWHVLLGDFGEACTTWAEVVTSALTYVNLGAGYFATAFIIRTGLARRGETLRSDLVWTIPVYWLLLSLAAWRAVVDLVRRPYHWEKTAHGLSLRRPALRPRMVRSSA